MLKSEIEKLRAKVNKLNEHLQLLKTSEAYQGICAIEDSDQYFKETKKSLKNKLRI